MQPYAWLLANGIKDIENRTRLTHIRGPILIHAGLSRSMMTADDIERCEEISGIRMPEHFDFGGIVGYAEIDGCFRRHASPWKDPAQWGWRMANAQPLRFRKWKGGRGFFRLNLPS